MKLDRFALPVGSLLYATVALAPMHANAAYFVDDFNGSTLDVSRWSILNGEAGISVANGLLEFVGGPDHKRIDSLASYSPGLNGISAKATIKLGGDFQKFGFGVNGVPGPVGVYFDTYDDRYGDNNNSIRTLVLTDPSGSVFLFNKSVPVSWGSFHEFSIEWLPSKIRFLIDGSTTSEFTYLTTTASLPLGVWNDRVPRMQVDTVSVSAVPGPATAWLMAVGLLTLLGVRKTRAHLPS